jgi:hypothetical protein
MNEAIAEGTPTVSVPLRLTRARISDVLCCAFEGGSNYWYRIVEEKEPERFEFYSMPDLIDEGRGEKRPRVFPHLDYPLNPGGSLLIRTLEDDEIGGKMEWVLDLDAVEKGLALMAERHPGHFADILSEDDDAETGDVLLQCCLFGELVFG